MAEPFQELAGLGRLIHEPARPNILTAPSASESADFLFLQRLTGLTKGNLSSHLSKLEEAGLVRMKKQFVGKAPNTTVSLTDNTTVSLTDKGHIAIDNHWQQLEKLRKSVWGWQKT